MKPHLDTYSLKFFRVLWFFVWFFLIRFTPPKIFNVWRVFLLKCFGANIEWTSMIYPTVKIFQPWKLDMARNTCLGPNVNCYNYELVKIDENSIISQNTFLCTASHNYNSKKFGLISNKIIIEKNVWIAANCFVAPGIILKENSILLACSNLTKNTKKNYVYAGNPAVLKKKRILFKK